MDYAAGVARIESASKQLMDKPYKGRTFTHRKITGDLCDFYGFYL